MRLLKAVILTLSIIGCQQKHDISNFDEEAWKSDKNGCKLIRLSLAKALENSKDQIKAMSEEEVLLLLGRPDENKLYKRNQKFFIYHITPRNCGGTESKEHKYLSIRFTAMGLAKEVLIYSE